MSAACCICDDPLALEDPERPSVLYTEVVSDRPIPRTAHLTCYARRVTNPVRFALVDALRIHVTGWPDPPAPDDGADVLPYTCFVCRGVIHRPATRAGRTEVRYAGPAGTPDRVAHLQCWARQLPELQLEDLANSTPLPHSVKLQQLTCYYCAQPLYLDQPGLSRVVFRTSGPELGEEREVSAHVTCWASESDDLTRAAVAASVLASQSPAEPEPPAPVWALQLVTEEGPVRFLGYYQGEAELVEHTATAYFREYLDTSARGEQVQATRLRVVQLKDTDAARTRQLLEERRVAIENTGLYQGYQRDAEAKLGEMFVPD